MPKQRRTFTADFKRQMVQQYENGKPRAAIAREYELSPSALDLIDIDYLLARKSTINKLWNAIITFSRWAGKNDAIEDISVVKVADIKKQAPKAINKLERNKLIRDTDRTDNKRDNAILMTLFMTDIRVSEFFVLDRLDADLNERTVPLNVEVRRAIKKIS